jgi:hypothetical protein
VWVAAGLVVVLAVGLLIGALRAGGSGTRTTMIGKSLALRDKYNGERAVVTVTRVIDPATPRAGTSPGFADDRFVAVDYTVTNTGSVAIPGGDYASPWLDDNPGETVSLGEFTDCAGADAAIAPQQSVSTCAPFEIEQDEKVSVVDLELGVEDPEGRWTTS